MAPTDLVKGYEFEKGTYVVMDDEDMAQVKTELTRVINVVEFTEASVIDPVYVERPYYLVAIQPRDNGLVMYTLRHASEVRAMQEIEELKTVPATIKPDELKLARQVIGNFEVGGDLTQYKDAYQEELRRIIDAKIAGAEIVAPIDEAPPKVVNLMEALRQSLERVSTNKKKTAKVVSARATKAAAPRKRARG